MIIIIVVIEEEVVGFVFLKVKSFPSGYWLVNGLVGLAVAFGPACDRCILVACCYCTSKAMAGWCGNECIMYRHHFFFLWNLNHALHQALKDFFSQVVFKYIVLKHQVYFTREKTCRFWPLRPSLRAF